MTTEADRLALVVADVYELAGTLRRVGEDLAGAVGQTQARWQLLSVLSDGLWTASDAARRLGVSRQAVQRVADALIDDGLVRAEPNPGHRRAPHLRLTSEGEAALQAISTGSLGWRRAVARRMGSAELEALHDGLRRLLAAIPDDRPPRTR
jgi:DNA-binding MarR family transcriptional regulator